MKTSQNRCTVSGSEHVCVCVCVELGGGGLVVSVQPHTRLSLGVSSERHSARTELGQNFAHHRHLYCRKMSFSPLLTREVEDQAVSPGV